jgi:hypothetical protein
MKFQFTIRDLLLIIVIAALAAGWWIDHQRINRLVVQQWEYKEEAFLGADWQCKTAGADGWEICGIYLTAGTGNPIAILKRPLR